MKNTIVILFMALALFGCSTIGYKKFYNQVAPTKYPTTSQVMLFGYRNVDLNEIYELLFSDYLIIGKSAFNGPYVKPARSIPYAKSIGADILITTSQFKETRTSFLNLSIPTVNTTYFSGYSGNGSVYGVATTYGTKTTTVPIKVDRYDQHGIYLKNIDAVTPLWERTKIQYDKTDKHELSGIWENENYKIEMFRSGDQIVGFIEGVLVNRPA